MLLGFVVIVVATSFGSSPTAVPERTPTYTTERVQECTLLLNKAEQAGLIHQRPSDTRINIDERLWAELPATAKSGILQAMACEVYGRPPANLEIVVAYGYRSGRRLARYGQSGVSYD
jgi:hypothetical protein